ncbi:MAG TPA: GYD domain-containing protein [Terriglobales bacterium]|nr:GYD domain-containing protein [Terriglobales bacterium]
MPHYLHQVSYTSESWGALIAQPQNRIEVVSKAIEKVGGKVLTSYFAFGEYDVVVITELPDNVTAAGIAIAFAGGGACKSVRTTPLLTAQEAIQALNKAAESGYRPIAAGSKAA